MERGFVCMNLIFYFVKITIVTKGLFDFVREFYTLFDIKYAIIHN